MPDNSAMQTNHTDRASAGLTRWRVFYTHPRAEKKCERQLHEQDINVFLPTRTVVRQWSDRKKKVIEPLFRNYIFARVNERDRIRVLQTKGIAQCVTFSGVPAEVSQDEIEQLRLVQQYPGCIAPTEASLPKVGSEVVIDAGPLRGLKGSVTEHRGHVRIVVQIPSIRQNVRIEVPASLVTEGEV